MADRKEFTYPRWRAGVALAVVAVILAFVASDAVPRSRHLLEISEAYGVTVEAPSVDAGSPTGYASGRRSLLLPGSATDGHHWIMQTQTMLATGEWRLRHVDYDNAPEGRELHWASPFRWWLAALAWADHCFSGRPPGISVERAALVSGPVMFGLVAICLLTFLRGWRECWPAALTLVSLVAVPAFYQDYVAGRADHHGLANLCGMFTVWLLLFGSGVAIRTEAAERVPEKRNFARGCFVGSAIAGGVGLWISAATQVPVLMGAGLGVLVAGGLGRRDAMRLTWLRDPNLFRWWGGVGCGVSLAAWLIEYFPDHLGMHLEVNHPWYAAAWLGAGEILRLYARVLRDGWRAPGRSEWITGTCGVALVLLPPATIAIAGAQVFAVDHPLLWRISTRYGAEAQSLARLLATRESFITWLALILPMAWLVVPVLLAWRGHFPPEWRTGLTLALVPAVLAWILGYEQIRWLGLAWALTVPLISMCWLMLARRYHDRAGIIALGSVVAGLLFAPGVVHAVREARTGAQTTSGDMEQLAARDLAHWVRLRMGEKSAVVAATPGATTWLIAYGGLRGFGTLYWENIAGLEKTAELFAAPTADAARELAQRWGVTHVVYVSWNALEAVLVKEVRELPESAAVPADAFIMRLLQAPIPERWLRAIPFSLPAHPALADAQIRIWEVVPDQTPAEAVAHATNFFLEIGRADDATRLVPRLSRFRDDLNATVMLAAVASSQRDTAAFLAAMERVATQLEQAERMPLDDHVHLVVVLAVAQRMELARGHLQSCLRKATAHAVRRLTPGTLADLFALTAAFEVAWPDPELEQLAKKMLPPSRR